MLRRSNIKVVSCIILLIGVVALYWMGTYGEKSMGSIIGKKSSDITKIEFDNQDGTIKTVIKNKPDIDEFVDKLDHMVVKRCYVQPGLIISENPVKLYVGDKLYKSLDLCNSKDFIDVSFTRYQVMSGAVSSFNIKDFKNELSYKN